MKTLDETLGSLNKSDRIKIILPCGVYLQGRKNKVQRDIQQLKPNLEIAKTEISYIPVPFRINLCKCVVIYTIQKVSTMYKANLNPSIEKELSS